MPGKKLREEREDGSLPSAREQDKVLRPMTHVRYTGGDPTCPKERYVRLPPRSAVAWCIASHVNVNQPQHYEHLVLLVRKVQDGWELGDYFATENHHGR